MINQERSAKAPAVVPAFREALGSGRLLLTGGEPGPGPLDPLLSGDATATDVRLHRRYNSRPPGRLQRRGLRDQFAA
jgi:hypothetical protein